MAETAPAPATADAPAAAPAPASAPAPAPASNPLDTREAEVQELVLRTRDTLQAADSLASKFLTREVEYASGAAVNYSKTMKEAQDTKTALRKSQASLDGLARTVAGARVAASKLAATSTEAAS